MESLCAFAVLSSSKPLELTVFRRFALAFPLSCRNLERIFLLRRAPSELVAIQTDSKRKSGCGKRKNIIANNDANKITKLRNWKISPLFFDGSMRIDEEPILAFKSTPEGRIQLRKIAKIGSFFRRTSRTS